VVRRLLEPNDHDAEIGVVVEIIVFEADFRQPVTQVLEPLRGVGVLD
jgi:hypothetical protein